MILTFTNGMNQVTVVVKDRFFTRFLGLMGQKTIPYDGIFLTPSSGVHMFFMRTMIDVLFLKREEEGYRVIRKMERVRPWQWVPFVRGTTDILELRVGLGGKFQEGDLVTCSEPNPIVR